MDRHLEWFWKKKVCIEERFQKNSSSERFNFYPVSGFTNSEARLAVFWASNMREMYGF